MDRQGRTAQREHTARTHRGDLKGLQRLADTGDLASLAQSCKAVSTDRKGRGGFWEVAKDGRQREPP